MNMTVYVPRSGSPGPIRLAPGSAVVGEAREHGIDCHYEGAVYQQQNLSRFSDKLFCAADRRVAQYPTAARAVFPSDSLTPVAIYDAVRGVLVSVSDAEALSAWSGETVDLICGDTLPPGPLSWEGAVELCQAPGTRRIGHQRRPGLMVYRTQAGQLLRVDAMTRHAQILEHHDACVPGLLEQVEATQAEQRFVMGA